MQCRFEPAVFKKQRMPLLLALMIPSFLVDGILLYRVAQMHPAILNDAGVIDLPNLLMLLATNAVFTKSYAFIIYFVLKYIRKRSYLTICEDEVVFHKRFLVGGTEHYSYVYFAEYHIRNVQHVVIRKTGAIVVKGSFPTIFLCRDEKTEHHKSTRKRVVIPGYYSRIFELHEKMKMLYEKTDSGA